MSREGGSVSKRGEVRKKERELREERFGSRDGFEEVLFSGLIRVDAQHNIATTDEFELWCSIVESCHL